MMHKLIKLALRCIPVVIVLLVITRIVVANTLAMSGEKLHQIDTKIAKVQEENELLDQQIASLSSLVTIDVRARELGFIPPAKGQVMTIVADQFPFALR